MQISNFSTQEKHVDTAAQLHNSYITMATTKATRPQGVRQVGNKLEVVISFKGENQSEKRD